MSSAVFVDFTGMTVEQVTKLRDQFRAKGVAYRVLKNTLVKKALGDTAVTKKLGPALKGMTGVAWSFEEPSAAARVLKDFKRENEKLKVKAGLLEGDFLDAKAVEEQLAQLPSKDEARARALGDLSGPGATFRDADERASPRLRRGARSQATQRTAAELAATQSTIKHPSVGLKEQDNA